MIKVDYRDGRNPPTESIWRTFSELEGLFETVDTFPKPPSTSEDGVDSHGIGKKGKGKRKSILSASFKSKKKKLTGVKGPVNHQL